MTDLPAPPPHVQPYVEALGAEAAVDVLLALGGGEIYLAAAPKGKSRLEAMVGPERARLLAEAIGQLKVRVPTAKPWLARCLRARGLPVAEIGRRLHVTDKSVRVWLAAGDGAAPATDPRQFTLF